MLLAYSSDGSVVFQIGMNSLFPSGPPDDLLQAMFVESNVRPAGYLRVDDNNQATLVQQLLTRGVSRVANGVPVPGPEVAPVSAEVISTPLDGQTVIATVVDDDPLTITLPASVGGGNTTASRHQGYTPTTGDIVEAAWTDGQWVVADAIVAPTDGSNASAAS